MQALLQQANSINLILNLIRRMQYNGLLAPSFSSPAIWCVIFQVQDLTGHAYSAFPRMCLCFSITTLGIFQCIIKCLLRF